VILSSIIGSVNEDSFVRECFTVGFVDGERYPLDPVFGHLMERDASDLAYIQLSQKLRKRKKSFFSLPVSFLNWPCTCCITIG
jgi:hypothetical protein